MFVYVDDIIVIGDSVEDLVSRLSVIFSLLERFNLKLNKISVSGSRKK